MTVEQLTETGYQKWDDFVNAQSGSTLFHTTAWKDIVEQTFDYASYYYFAVQDGQILGVLPMFHIKGWLSGNALISTPFAVYGGILAKNPDVHDILLEQARSLAQDLGAEYVELRHMEKSPAAELQTKDSLYATFINEMPQNIEDIYEGLPKEARRMVRKGRNNGLDFKFEKETLETFYHIYAVSVQKFGTPVFSKKLFQNCLKILKDKATILNVYKDDRAIASVLTFYYKDTILPYYSGMLPEAKTLAPHNLMYLTLMEHGRENGYSTFDFGRSKVGTGAAKFKEHMGFEPIPLPYQFYMMNGGELPNKNQTNPKYALATSVWKRLPLSMTKLIGPHVVKLFP